MAVPSCSMRVLKGVAMKAYQIVDADFVKREIGRMPIVDVRPPLRYDTAHIPSAINIRLDVAAASDDPVLLRGIKGKTQ